ncbi:MAG: radical SAM protein [Candidatus Cloacimonetes bacterium]|nr:radical SAM protein [Candidatus Cloacimonadota bacterium]
MKLSEIFYSIQGESTFAGLPCIFIRFSGCNLSCSYCDTKYAYEQNFELSVEKILDKIKKYSPVKLVEITGGEPLLQKEIYSLFEKLHSKNYQILLETNGAIFVNKVPKYVKKIMDIKTPTSKMSDKMKWENLNFLTENDEIKFVLSDKNDFDWAIKKIRKYDLQKYKILFSPNKSKLNEKSLAEWILKTKMPIRLQMQLHKIIWKNKKGV